MTTIPPINVPAKIMSGQRTFPARENRLLLEKVKEALVIERGSYGY